jgi:hypothetical protein
LLDGSGFNLPPPAGVLSHIHTAAQIQQFRAIRILASTIGSDAIVDGPVRALSADGPKRCACGAPGSANPIRRAQGVSSPDRAPVVCLIFASGALLLLLGIVAPSRLSSLNRVWLKVGTAIAKVVNPIILALLFFLVVTPMAFFMRIVGKRPLRLAADRTAATYWIEREPPPGGASTMRRQF